MQARVVFIAALALFLYWPVANADVTTCYPDSGDYNTGSTIWTDKTRTSEIAALSHEDGWVKFNISAIASDRIPLSVEFHFYVNDATSAPSWAVTRVTSDPVTASPSTIAGEINAPPFSEAYNYRHETGYTTGWKSVMLGGTVIEDFDACTVQGWFVLGVRKDVNYLLIDGWAETNPPYIVVEHEPRPPSLTWYVDDDAPGDPGPGDPEASDPLEDGSPAHPFDAVQEGIDAAGPGIWNTDVVVLADGIYTGTGNRDLDFGGKNLTVRSANGPLNCIIDCQGNDVEHHQGFHLHGGQNATSVIDGLTIRNGYAVKGGGIYVESGAPTIINNRIVDNIATGNASSDDGGGGISCARATLIRNNFISGNKVIQANGYGGGIFIGSGQVIGNTITDNTTYGNYSGGGGVRMSSGLLEGNIITGNTCQEYGGGVYVSYSLAVVGNLIADNFCGGWGGGIHCSTSSYGFAELYSNEITGNTAEISGGGIYCGSNTNSAMAGNTVAGNSAYAGGGFLCNANAVTSITDSIFWDNSATVGSQLYVGDYAPYESTLTISYSDVEGGLAGVYVHEDSTINWGSGMIDADPLFVSGLAGEYCLSQVAAGQATDSPCLDAGSGAAAVICFEAADGSLCMGDLSTRTDQVSDVGLADIGRHYDETDWISVAFSCVPAAGTLPFDTTMSVTLGSNHLDQTRRVAGRIDVELAGGQHFANWRRGFTNLGPGGRYSASWNQTLPVLGSLIGVSTFHLLGEDVTPPPYNQPPYRPAGDTDSDSCTLTGIIP